MTATKSEADHLRSALKRALNTMVMASQLLASGRAEEARRAILTGSIVARDDLTFASPERVGIDECP